ncbi:MAG: hypothetical protein EOO27_02405 [Comamonadaceae bacterium]|nr:MAG: hypothetical protein EOO27_02405 [Comamonadaceae bacterium]
MTVANDPKVEGRGQDGGQIQMRMSELVLKTRSLEQLQSWYALLLGHGPFLERKPSPDTTKTAVGGQERASDVRLAFFKVHEDEHPYNQILALFEVPDLAVDSTGPGLHHFQFMMSSLNDLATKFEQLSAEGFLPHRSANHGPLTSFYYRDPDQNIIELTCSNFATREGESEYYGSEKFRRNPSGVELDPADFVARLRAGEPLDRLLAIPG